MNQKITLNILIGIFLLSVIVGILNLILPNLNSESDFSSSQIKNIFNSKAMSYPADTIAVLNIMTEIDYNQQDDYLGFRRSGALYWISALQSVEDNPNIKAVILRINSPGGTVGATQEVYNEIKRLRKKGKIVTVSMGDLAASGAYYLSCAADYIVCNPGSLVGSIGVIISGIDLSELFNKIGINYNIIKSGKNKDILSSYRKMTPEERDLLQDVVMDTYNQFFQSVAEGRKIKPADLRKLADGRIFSGNQALKNRLVDELGDFQQTVDITAKMARINGTPNVMELKPESDNIFKYLTASMSSLISPKKDFNLINIGKTGLKNSSPVQYLYEF